MAIVILALCIMLALTPMVQANSGPTHYAGTTAAGVHVELEECPIEVVHENLTFDIPEFPREYYEDESAFTDYQARVTAEYTLRNPTDADVTVELLFPFGIAPGYAPYSRILPEYCGITVDGAEIDLQLRHSLVWGSEFDMAEDSARLHDGFMEHGFYRPDMSVTVYTYRPRDVAVQDWIEARVRLDSDPARTKYILDPANSLRTESDHVVVGSSVRARDAVTLYVIGEAPGGELGWELYSNNEPIEGNLECVDARQTTLKEILLSYRPEGSEVSDTDWYNAMVQMMDQSECAYGYIDMNHFFGLMSWYEYELIIPAGGTVVNTVKAPIYPDINSGWEPPVYSYEYLLSPAKGWADFGTLDITVKTPYHMTQCNLDGFEKTEEGCALHLEGLPDRELVFVLSEARNPVKPGSHTTVICWLFAGVVALIAVGIELRKRK